jgi:hypothetical protein
MTLPALFTRCPYCYRNSKRCDYCDGDHFIPIDNDDVAILTDVILDVITPILRRKTIDIDTAFRDASDHFPALAWRRCAVRAADETHHASDTA